jgi:hypothetical protein
MRGVLASLLVAVSLCAQMKMSVEQLRAFIRSSIELRHDDRKVAEYLRKVTLTNRLDDRAIEELQGTGAGPRTVEALRALGDASKALPPPPVAAPKPPRPVIPPPSAAEQKKLLEEVREYALHYTKRLPDFICLQVIRRYADPSGLEFWQKHDEVTVRLSFFEQKEDYKVVLVNSRPSDIAYQNLDGATSTGEFGTMLKEIFELKTKADFAWLRWATLRGKRAHVIAYRVGQANSEWRISYQRSLDYVPGYKGLIYVDSDTGMVMKVTLEAEGIPPSFPIQQASQTLDYDYIDIAGQPFMLPLRSEMRMRESKLLAKNEVEFRMYRKFGAEAVITFDTPAPLSEEQTKEQPVKP